MPTSSLARSEGTSGPDLRLWLALIDAVLRAIEEIAWSTRNAVEATCEAARAELGSLRQTAGALRADLAERRELIARLLESGATLSRIAARYRLHITYSAFVTRAHAAARLERLHEETAADLHALCTRQGGALLKVGQLLSARPDLVPPAFVRRLSALQDSAEPAPFREVRATIERELGGPIEELFVRFEAEPIAAASIGQVHRGELADGREVAVKVKRPGIDALVALDLELLAVFVRALEPSLPPSDYETVIAEISAAVRAELDYRRERSCTERAASDLDALPRVRAPRTVPERCSDSVLTTELAAGRKLTIVLDELAARRALGDLGADEMLSEALGDLLRAYVRQILVHGRFQADPHPGNLLHHDTEGLTILDFGCTAELSPEVRAAYLTLFSSFLIGDGDRVVEALGALGFRTRSGRPDTLVAFAEALLRELRAVLDGQESAWPTAEDMLVKARALMAAANDDPVDGLPAHFVLVARVLGTLGGLFAHYRPRLDLARDVAPELLAATL